jgi:thioredoxin 1
MRIELFYTTGCQKCAHARAELKSAAEEIPGTVWRELDALDHLDYAIELGVTTLPAIVIDRKMIFSSLPTPRQLRDALKKRVKKSV